MRAVSGLLRPVIEKQQERVIKAQWAVQKKRGKDQRKVDGDIVRA